MRLLLFSPLGTLAALGALATTAGAVFLGCGSSDATCASFSIASSAVVVEDEATGAVLCDATVTAVLLDGGTSESFVAGGPFRLLSDGAAPPSCAYGPPSGLPYGMYTVRATAPGYADAKATGFSYSTASCTDPGDYSPPLAPEVTMALAPASDAGSP